MAKNDEDKRMNQAFDIISTYFVDVLTNHTYNHAKGTQGRNQFADVYRNCLHSYLLGLRNDRSIYNTTAESLSKYYETYYPGTTFSHFVDTIVYFMVPRDYFDLMTAKHRDETLHMVIGDLVAELIAYITSPEFTAKTSARQAQDRGVKILQTKRIELSNKFMKRQTGATGMLSSTTVEKMKMTIRKLVKEKAEERATAGKLLNYCKKLEVDLVQMRTREKKLAKLVKLLRAPDKTTALIGLKAQPRDEIAEAVDDPFDSTPPPPEIIAENAQMQTENAQARTETKRPQNVPVGLAPIEEQAKKEQAKKEQMKSNLAAAVVSDEPADEDEEGGDEGDEGDEDDEGSELTL